MLMQQNDTRRLLNYSIGSSTLLLTSQRSLVSMMAYGKGGTSLPGKSSFLGMLQLLKSSVLAASQPSSSFLRRARPLMLPGGLPGLTLYPAALVVPRGLPGLVLNPAALVVPSGRPVLVRYPANLVVPDGLPLRPDLAVPFFFLEPSGTRTSPAPILTACGWKSAWVSCNWHVMALCIPCGKGARLARDSCKPGFVGEA